MSVFVYNGIWRPASIGMDLDLLAMFYAIYTRPVSLMRMPKQTSAPHILLYSKDFFIRLVLRRPRFWRIDFLLLGLGISDSSSMVPMPSLYI